MSSHYATVARAIDALSRAHDDDSLNALASAAGLSPSHFQRVFTEWVGVSPKRFAQHLSLQRAREALADGASVLEAAMRAGVSGPGRLHDLAVSHDAMTPGELRRGARGLTLHYGWASSPFGEVFATVSARGLCSLSFCDDRETELAAARLRWPGARFVQRDDAVADACDGVFSLDRSRALRLHLRGSPWQIKVWEALLRIPSAKVVSYDALAEVIGAPKAARAVGNAVGQNPIAFVIPCHRVIRASGAISGYRWGVGRKRAMLAWERCQVTLDDDDASLPDPVP